MMMKKLLYTLLAFTFALASCSEEINMPETVPADCIMLKVFNGPMTKAVTDRSGEEYEKTLKRLDCFFYVKGQTDRPCVYYQKVDVDEVTTAEIPFYVDESVINTIFPSGNTTCDVFVIANLPSGTYAAGMTGTDVATLNKTSLQLGQGYDAVDQNFLMAGLDGVKNKIDPHENGWGPYDFNLYHLSEEEKAKLQGLPVRLEDALDALEADHAYLTAGGVFPEELLRNFIKTKRAECAELSKIPHPAEFDKYYNL